MHQESSAEFNSCLIKDNFAIQGGVGVVENLGKFKIRNSVVTGNQAFQSSIINMVDSYDTFSIVENTTFTQNLAMKLSDFASKKGTIDKAYFDKITQLIPLLSIKLDNAITHCFDLSKAKLAITTGSTVTNERNFISGNVA